MIHSEHKMQKQEQQRQRQHKQTHQKQRRTHNICAGQLNNDSQCQHRTHSSSAGQQPSNWNEQHQTNSSSAGQHLSSCSEQHRSHSSCAGQRTNSSGDRSLPHLDPKEAAGWESRQVHRQGLQGFEWRRWLPAICIWVSGSSSGEGQGVSARASGRRQAGLLPLFGRHSPAPGLPTHLRCTRAA